MLEEELRGPVTDFFRQRGQAVFHEVPINGRIADLVACGKGLVGVELKLRDWKRGLRQAMSYQLACPHTYLCLPFGQALRMRYKAHYFDREGVGVLGSLTDRGEVREIIPARPSRRLLPFLAQFLERTLFQAAPAGTLFLASGEQSDKDSDPSGSGEGRGDGVRPNHR